VDGAAFDDSTQLAFASCGEGVTTILKEETPEKLNVVQTLETKRSARTMALDPQNASHLFAGSRFSTGAFAISGASPTAADYDPEHDEASRLRSGQIAAGVSPNESCTCGPACLPAATVMVARRPADDYRRSWHAGQQEVGNQSGVRV